jgi:hypothetical protein
VAAAASRGRGADAERSGLQQPRRAAAHRGEAARGEEAVFSPLPFGPRPSFSVSPRSLGSWWLTKMAGAGARAGCRSATGTF